MCAACLSRDGTDRKAPYATLCYDVQAVCKAASDAEGDWLTVVQALDLPHVTGSFLPFKPHVDGTDIKEQPMQTLCVCRRLPTTTTTAAAAPRTLKRGARAVS